MTEKVVAKDHVYLTWEQLAEVLDLQGRPIKVWVENDQDYLHILMEKEVEVGGEWGNFVYVGPHGYVEGRGPFQNRPTARERLEEES